MSPAQVPKTGCFAANARSGSVRPNVVHELAHGGALAARDHQAVEALELLGQPDFHRVGAEPAQHHARARGKPLEERGRLSGVSLWPAEAVREGRRRLPTAMLDEVRLADGADLQAGHGVAQSARRPWR